MLVVRDGVHVKPKSILRKQIVGQPGAAAEVIEARTLREIYIEVSSTKQGRYLARLASWFRLR